MLQSRADSAHQRPLSISDKHVSVCLRISCSSNPEEVAQPIKHWACDQRVVGILLSKNCQN